MIDFYRRYVRTEAPDSHYLNVAKLATAFWGVFASLVAIWAAELGSLIEVVNRFGSFFYGSILGVFLLAVGWKRANGTGAFVGLIAGMVTVAWFATNTRVSFLWHNVDRRRHGVRRRRDRVGGSQAPHTEDNLMATPLLLALVAVIAVIVVSWMLGEVLRQRKK